MNRTIGGLPILYWAVGLGVGVIGFLWIKKRSGGSTAAPAAAKPNPQAFTQAQEVQDFQVFSALTGAQQASDLNFLSEVAGLFSGGSSTGTPASPVSSGGGASAGGGGTTAPPVSSVPSPPSTGTAAPATVPASAASNPGVTYLEPGGPVNFSAPPPPGFGYGFQNGQWGLTQGSGVGYVAA